MRLLLAEQLRLSEEITSTVRRSEQLYRAVYGAAGASSGASGSARSTATVEQRLEAAKVALCQRFHWSRRTILALRPVERPGATMAVDQWRRLYFGREWCDALTDAQFVAVLWHEVNHLLRDHPLRLDGLPNHQLANVAGDLEINGDIRRVVRLPDGMLLPEHFGGTDGQLAETHYRRLRKEQEERREEQERQRQEQEEQDQDSDQEEEQDSDSSDQESDSSDQESDDGSPGPDGSEQQPGDSGEEESDNGSPGAGDQDQDSNGSDSDSSSSSVQTEEEPDPALPDPQCGSAAGNPGADELPEPTEEEQSELEQEQREEAKEILEQPPDTPGGYGTGPAAAVREAARRLLNVSRHDWRQTVATVIRTASEIATDEAEDYTFRRRSRRASAADPGVIPGSFRPVPHLTVGIDGSGSMDRGKVDAALRETFGILARLAIPTFSVHIYSDGTGPLDGCDSHGRVASMGDANRLLEQRRPGGTDMMSCLAHIARSNAGSGIPEVIVLLTDCQCPWDASSPAGNVPVIVGGIGPAVERYRELLPSWCTFVTIAPAEPREELIRR